jgi:hypothetical protein
MGRLLVAGSISYSDAWANDQQNRPAIAKIMKTIIEMRKRKWVALFRMGGGFGDSLSDASSL